MQGEKNKIEGLRKDHGLKRKAWRTPLRKSGLVNEECQRKLQKTHEKAPRRGGKKSDAPTSGIEKNERRAILVGCVERRRQKKDRSWSQSKEREEKDGRTSIRLLRQPRRKRVAGGA